MYALFLERMGKLYEPEKIKGPPFHASEQTLRSSHHFTDGKFGAMMNISLTNEVSDGERSPSKVMIQRWISITSGSSHAHSRLEKIRIRRTIPTCEPEREYETVSHCNSDPNSHVCRANRGIVPFPLVTGNIAACRGTNAHLPNRSGFPYIPQAVI